MNMDEKTRSIVSAVVLLVISTAGLFGLKLENGLVTDIVSAIAVLASAIYGIWKNHNFTAEAVQAQQFLNDLKGKE